MVDEGEGKGIPRFRVMGAIIMRWARVVVPLAILRGVKSTEAAPRGGEGDEAMTVMKMQNWAGEKTRSREISGEKNRREELYAEMKSTLLITRQQHVSTEVGFSSRRADLHAWRSAGLENFYHCDGILER